jgi:UDP-GlcNAc:undecaprenyl-phosphate/decaprenyl-phosphate GlcNAc-1-phosphate transferase
MPAPPTLALGVAFALSVCLTLATRSAARRFGFVAQPRPDRWHRRPTALLGGIAIAATFTVVVLAFAPLSSVGPVVALTLAVATIGLVDDLKRLNPATKLVFQAIVAAMALAAGHRLGWTGSLTIDSLLTLLWLVGLANAFNLLDNMDGLAAGVAAIAALAYLLLSASQGSPLDVLFFSAFAGSVLGFLVFNFQPASIFMGDAGSLFLGFTLALLSTRLTPSTGAGGISAVLIPVAILSVPIFDTTLVTFLRRLAGRKVSVGGKDHSSHRLVGLGLPERRAVLVLYAFAAVASLAGLSVSYLDFSHANVLVGLFFVALTFFGIHLANVRVYDNTGGQGPADAGPVNALLVRSFSRTRVLDVLLDVSLITVAYYAAFRIRFDDAAFELFFPVFLRSLPVVVAVSVASLWWAGAYRGLWSYFAVPDAVTLARGTVLATICSVAAVSYVFRFEHQSRAVFVFAGALMLVLLAAGRSSFRLAHDLAAGNRGQRRTRRVAIYGAGDAGFNVLQVVRTSRLPFEVIGLVDDDGAKHGRSVLGIEVLGDVDVLLKLMEQQAIEGILVSTMGIGRDRMERLRTACIERDVFLLRFRAGFEDLVATQPPASPSEVRSPSPDQEAVHFATEWWPDAMDPGRPASRFRSH